MVTAATKLKLLVPRKKSYEKPRQYMKKQRRYLADKGQSGQSYGFSSSHVWMWELEHTEAESWRINAFKLWCWRILIRVPWAARSNQLILKEINPEYSLEGLMLKLQYFFFFFFSEAPIFWPPDAKSWVIGKEPNAGKNWEQEEKGVTEDEMIGWHHWIIGHEFEQTLGDSEGQGSLVCCSPWGTRVRHDWVTKQQQQQRKKNSKTIRLQIEQISTGLH